MSIVGVRRGDTVRVANANAGIQRIGFENVRQRHVQERDAGQVRIDGMLQFFVGGVQVPGGTYYGGNVNVSPISFAEPIRSLYGTSRRRRLSVQFFRVGGTVSSDSLIGMFIEGVGQLIPFPIIGNKEVPIIEPAAAEPGSFVQYVINTATIGFSGSTGSVDQSQELGLSSVSIKVTLEGYVN